RKRLILIAQISAIYFFFGFLIFYLFFCHKVFPNIPNFFSYLVKVKTVLFFVVAVFYFSYSLKRNDLTEKKKVLEEAFFLNQVDREEIRKELQKEVELKEIF